MRELYSRALVLDRKDSGEVDGLVSFFTEDFGKIVAFAKSIRKPTSKLSAHLQPLTFVKVRFIQRAGPRDGWAVIDCLRDDEFLGDGTYRRWDLAPLMFFLNKSLFELQTDRRLWEFLKHIFMERYAFGEMARGVLNLMGFDPRGTVCFSCGAADVGAFHAADQIFLCERCASKFSSDAVLLLEEKK